ncbi:bifunctional DNA primase/polymerase [Thermanaerothrix sp.]|uniref:bifunctional DNA primase/polymerase n=1 Tax=Thermanaerothrix sp. TaxID=2972675 RepID=UPI002ADE474E|nr:bifunctional DNA primase/polymerase [Thermanaerothrix sp.]
MDVLTEAIKWFGLGVSVIPVRNQSKVAAIRWQAYQNRLPTPDEIVHWFGRPLFRNYGVLCGKRHEQPGYLVVLDFDVLDAGVSWLLSMGWVTYTVATARGLHAYFLTEQPAETVHFEGGDIKGSGYVLGAGSIHPSGAVYNVLNDAPILGVRSIRDVMPDLPEPVKREPKTFPILSKPEPKDAWEAAEYQRPNLIETIKARFSILDFLPDLHLRKTSQSGHLWITRCPLHDDHTPSMWVDTEHQICGCFAGCNNRRPMDVINLAAQLWNCSNAEAIDRLRQML